MAYRVTVAALTVRDRFFRVPFEAGLEMPYAERPKVALDVEGTETVKSVLERACSALDVTVSGLPGSPGENLAFIAFYEGADEEGFGDRQFAHLWALTTVDRSGKALWSRHFEAVTYDELVRAGKARVVKGDVLRPYLIANPYEGNGILLTWEGLGNAFQILKDILAVAGGLAATVTLKDRLTQRFRRVKRRTELEGDLRVKNRLRRAERAENAVAGNWRSWARRGCAARQSEDHA